MFVAIPFWLSITALDREVVPDVKNLEEYQFTMYHGYKIKRITNERGEELEY